MLSIDNHDVKLTAEVWSGSSERCRRGLRGDYGGGVTKDEPRKAAVIAGNIVAFKLDRRLHLPASRAKDRGVECAKR